MCNFIAYIALIVLISSCSNQDESIKPKDSDYFPLKVGVYQIYDVEETRIDQVNTTKLIYQLRTMVSDSFPNLEGGYTYMITREKRTNSVFPWQPVDVWTARLDARQLVIQEENISYVKLVFPLSNGLIWNGNALNTLGGDEKCGSNTFCDNYQLENRNSNFVVNSGLAFAETVTVNQNNNSDVIVSQDVRKEVYARSVGLIYKDSRIVEYCTTPDCLGKQQIDKGFIVKQVIREYGS